MNKMALLTLTLTLLCGAPIGAQPSEQEVKQIAAPVHVGADIAAIGDPDLIRVSIVEDLDSGSLDLAVNKARDLVTAEPNNAKNHLLLARAITAKFKRDNPHNRLLYEECLSEWAYVNRNILDPFEKDEAKNQLMELRLDKVAAKLKGTPKSKSVLGRLLPGSDK